MSRPSDTRCLHCNGKLPLLQRLKNSQFCSTAHEQTYRKEQQDLAVERLHQTHDSLQAYRPPDDIESILGPRAGASPVPKPQGQKPPQPSVSDLRAKVDERLRETGAHAKTHAKTEAKTDAKTNAEAGEIRDPDEPVDFRPSWAQLSGAALYGEEEETAKSAPPTMYRPTIPASTSQGSGEELSELDQFIRDTEALDKFSIKDLDLDDMTPDALQKRSPFGRRSGEDRRKQEPAVTRFDREIERESKTVEPVEQSASSKALFDRFGIEEPAAAPPVAKTEPMVFRQPLQPAGTVASTPPPVPPTATSAPGIEASKKEASLEALGTQRSETDVFLDQEPHGLVPQPHLMEIFGSTAPQHVLPAYEAPQFEPSDSLTALFTGILASANLSAEKAAAQSPLSLEPAMGADFVSWEFAKAIAGQPLQPKVSQVAPLEARTERENQNLVDVAFGSALSLTVEASQSALSVEPVTSLESLKFAVEPQALAPTEVVAPELEFHEQEASELDRQTNLPTFAAHSLWEPPVMEEPVVSVETESAEPEVSRHQLSHPQGTAKIDVATETAPEVAKPKARPTSGIWISDELLSGVTADIAKGKTAKIDLAKTAAEQVAANTKPATIPLGETKQAPPKSVPETILEVPSEIEETAPSQAGLLHLSEMVTPAAHAAPTGEIADNQHALTSDMVRPLDFAPATASQQLTTASELESLQPMHSAGLMVSGKVSDNPMARQTLTESEQVRTTQVRTTPVPSPISAPVPASSAAQNNPTLGQPRIQATEIAPLLAALVELGGSPLAVEATGGPSGVRRGSDRIEPIEVDELPVEIDLTLDLAIDTTPEPIVEAPQVDEAPVAEPQIDALAGEALDTQLPLDWGNRIHAAAPVEETVSEFRARVSLLPEMVQGEIHFPRVRLEPHTFQRDPIPANDKDDNNADQNGARWRGMEQAGKTDEEERPTLLNGVRGFWNHAPRDLKLLLIAIPVLLGLVFHPSLPKISVAAPESDLPGEVQGAVGEGLSASFANFKQAVSERAAVALEEDFRQGLDQWTSRGGATTQWAFDQTGFVQPGPLALYGPSMGLIDYQMQFLGLIDQEAMSWVVRAKDFRNYYVVKLMMRKAGPLPSIVVTRYAVIDGVAMDRVDTPVPIDARADTIYRVRMDLQGDDFTLAVQEQIIDSWQEPRLDRGGIGFYTGRGEASRVRWVQITHQYDLLGRLCAYLAPYNVSPTSTAGGY